MVEFGRSSRAIVACVSGSSVSGYGCDDAVAIYAANSIVEGICNYEWIVRRYRQTVHSAQLSLSSWTTVAEAAGAATGVGANHAVCIYFAY